MHPWKIIHVFFLNVYLALEYEWAITYMVLTSQKRLIMLN